MSFIANQPVPPAEQELPVTNENFFPAIDPALLRQTARLDGTVTAARLRYSITTAITSVNAELSVWRAAQVATGIDSLASVPASQVDGQTEKVHQYLRAVYSLTQADLVERYRDYDTTAKGAKEATKLELRADDLRRDARWAISDILSIRRTTVELI